MIVCDLLLVTESFLQDGNGIVVVCLGERQAVNSIRCGSGQQGVKVSDCLRNMSSVKSRLRAFYLSKPHDPYVVL